MLRPSGLWKWGRCEKRALSEIGMPNYEDRQSIAAWVGTEVHAKVANPRHKTGDVGMAGYDKITPTQQVAGIQVKEITDSVNDALEAAGIEIVAQEKELTAIEPLDQYWWLYMGGTVDVIGLTGSETLLIDLKTGDMIDNAWLQLGAYAILMEQHGLKPDRAIILHAPRSKWDAMTGGVSVTLHDLTPRKGDIDLLMEEARAAIQRIGDLLANLHSPIARPGPHCTDCPASNICLARNLKAKGD